MKNFIKVLTLSFAICALNLYAQDKEDYSSEPGYVDFGNLSGFYKSDKVTEINLESYLLKMASNLTANSDPEMSKMLSGLKLVKVYSFDADAKDSKELANKISEMDISLKNKNWDRIVKVKSSTEYTNVYVKSADNQKDIVGLVVTSLQKDGESAFVNIVGKIDMDALGRLGEKFDIPALGKAHKN